MWRVAYALAVITLVGGSAVMAQDIDRDSRAERRAAILVMATWAP